MFRTYVCRDAGSPSSAGDVVTLSNHLMEALANLAECRRSLPASETLFHVGDPVRCLYLVVIGEIRLTRMLPHGSELIIQRAEAGAIVSEASLFAERYCCNAVATEASVVRVIPIQVVRSALRDDAALMWEWVRHLAREVGHARARAEILSLKTVARRVEAWRALNNGVLPPKGRWRQLAGEIGVSPEALYREFARRG